MKKILAITRDARLVEALELDLPEETVSADYVSDWGEGREALESTAHEILLVDSEGLAVDDFQVLAELDQVLDEFPTEGVLFLRDGSSHGDELARSLSSFRSVEETPESGFAPLVDTLGTFVEEVDETSPEPDDTPSDRGPEPGPAGGAPSVERQLPPLDSGEYESVEPIRFVRAAVENEFDGGIRFENSGLERGVAFRNGTLIRADSPDLSSPDDVRPIFTWDDATAQVREGVQLDGDPVDPASLALEGIRTHLQERRAIEILMPEMEAHPAPTDLWEATESSLVDDDILAPFLDACDGDRILEEVVTAVDCDERSQFQAAYFAAKWDFVVFLDDPAKPPVEVVYHTDELGVGGGGGSSDPDQKDEELRERLRERKWKLKEMSVYEVFGVSEGCGEEAIRQKYYDFVHKYHPDTYRIELTDETQQLAEEVFLGLKKVYRKILELEGEGGGQVQAVSGDRAEANRQFLEKENERTARGDESEDVIGLSDESTGDVDDGAAIADGTEDTSDEPTDEEKDEDDRRAKLETLRDRAGSSELEEMLGRDPIGDDDAQEFFNTGYKALKNENEEIAFELVRKAHDYEPHNGLYKTFYGYLLFLTDPDRADEARNLLEEAIQIQNRQALPDAHLFLGRILKVQEKPERAKRHFEQSLELDPSSLEAKRELRVFEMREENEGAEETTGDGADSSTEGGGGDPTFSDDPVGYLKSLLTKDVF
ncbi:MAG: DnaJ domain-containing protein [Bradymonadaceae bacterium]